jgi:ribosomal protein S15P/S13E
MIGVILRDRYGIPLTRYVAQKTITEVMKASGQALRMPEDLEVLLKKADGLRKHLERNRTDYPNKRSLAGIESKIHRLVKYYKTRGVLAQNWKYKPFAASVE